MGVQLCVGGCSNASANGTEGVVKIKRGGKEQEGEL